MIHTCSTTNSASWLEFRISIIPFNASFHFSLPLNAGAEREYTLFILQNSGNRENSKITKFYCFHLIIFINATKLFLLAKKHDSFVWVRGVWENSQVVLIIFYGTWLPALCVLILQEISKNLTCTVYQGIWGLTS